MHDPSATDFDVVVIGAGFAGAAAARELATRGCRTLVLESLDRPGGRTWTTSLSNGDLVEVGGTYVHWFQPHTWSEMTRYGLVDDLVPGGEAPSDTLAPAAGGGLAWTPAEDYAKREHRLLTAFFEGSEAVIPRPFQPRFATEAVQRTDTMTIADRLDELDLDEPDRALIEAFFGTHTGVPADRGSYLAEVRWWAPSGHRFEAMQESVWTYRLAHGTGTLVRRMLADGEASVRYGAHVSAIATRDGRTSVTTSDGATTTCRAVVVATPPGVWADIDFAPPLPDERLEAAHDGLQAPGGSKGFAVVRGEPRSIQVQPRPGHPLGALWTSHRRGDDEQVMVFFGTGELADATDRDQVERAIQDLLPHVTVTEVLARNFVRDDPTLRGAWPVMRPGHFTRYAPEVRLLRPEGPIAFAASELATGWTGYIDGAIEAGIVAAQQIQRLLGPAALADGGPRVGAQESSDHH